MQVVSYPEQQQPIQNQERAGRELLAHRLRQQGNSILGPQQLPSPTPRHHRFARGQKERPVPQPVDKEPAVVLVRQHRESRPCPGGSIF